MFLHLSVSHSVHGGDVHGRGACMAGVCVWQWGVHGIGACVAGGHV